MSGKRSRFLPIVTPDAHKYTRGIVGVAAGSNEYPGAAVLACGGARRGGAGYVKYLAQADLPTAAVLARFPDVVPITCLDSIVDTWVIGSGQPHIESIPDSTPTVLDSSAMKFALIPRKMLTIITPHEGEVEILGYKMGNRSFTAQTLANELGVIVVLKGSGTIIAAPHLEPFIDLGGGSELATAGSGDILAGIIGSMLASWRPTTLYEAHEVVFKAVKFHSEAGRIARLSNNPVVATDILDALSKIHL